MEHKSNDTDRKKSKFSDKNQSQCYFVHDKSHKTGLGLKLGPCGDSFVSNCLFHGTAC